MNFELWTMPIVWPPCSIWFVWQILVNGHMKCQLKPIPVSVTALMMRSYHCHGNRNIVVVCLRLVVFHYSLRDNQLTDSGAVALATALQHNKSLEELKWVANWLSCYQEMWVLSNVPLSSRVEYKCSYKPCFVAMATTTMPETQWSATVIRGYHWLCS